MDDEDCRDDDKDKDEQEGVVVEVEEEEEVVEGKREEDEMKFSSHIS